MKAKTIVAVTTSWHGKPERYTDVEQIVEVPYMDIFVNNPDVDQCPTRPMLILNNGNRVDVDKIVSIEFKNGSVAEFGGDDE